jgi:hypothetical protein
MANDLLYKASLHLGASPQNKRSSLLYKIQTVGNIQHLSRPICKLWAFVLAPDAVGAVLSAFLLLATEVLSILHRLSSDWERTV